MRKSSHLWEAHQRIFRNSLLWDKLYDFLVVRVRYWVYSARLSLWRGNEEEIADDIIQDSIIGTLTYALQYAPGSGEQEPLFSRPLLQVSMALAYQHYCQQEQRDAHMVETRMGYHQAQGFLILAGDESLDWHESALASAFQEWFCECLAGTVMKIPSRPRIALLTHWANHVRTGSQQARILIGALSRRNICLDEFQRSLSPDPRARREHRALLHFAYRQLLIEPEQARHIFWPGSVDLGFGEIDAGETGRLDRDLIRLGSHLEATAPKPRPALAFREALCNQLLDLVVDYQIERALAGGEIVLPGESSSEPGEASRVHVDKLENDKASAFQIENEDDEIDDVEIDMLAGFLKEMTPLAEIDPVFRATLREKLLAIPRAYAETQETRTVDHALAETARFLSQVPQEDSVSSAENENGEPAPLSLAWLQTQNAAILPEQKPSDQIVPFGDD